MSHTVRYRLEMLLALAIAMLLWAATTLAQSNLPRVRHSTSHPHLTHPGKGPRPLLPSTPVATEAVAYSFCNLNNCTDGSVPQSPLMQAADGNLYGTTNNGGANNGGTVFQYNPATATEQNIYSFCSQASCTDGVNPSGGLVQDAEGNLWGMTTEGGGNVEEPPTGAIYKITPAGDLTVVYSFCTLGGCDDGAAPLGALVIGSDGNLYGMASQFGQNQGGTLFQLTPSGNFTVLYNFCAVSGALDCTDGYDPEGDLI